MLIKREVFIIILISIRTGSIAIWHSHSDVEIRSSSYNFKVYLIQFYFVFKIIFFQVQLKKKKTVHVLKDFVFLYLPQVKNKYTTPFCSTTWDINITLQCFYE